MSSPTTLSSPTFESSPTIETTYHKSNCYILGLFQDKTQSTLITFSLSTPNPYDSILSYLQTDFNPGSGASAKSNGVRLFLLMESVNGEERQKIAAGYLKMLEQIVSFRVYSWGILVADRNGYVDGEVLRLGGNKDVPFSIGSRGNRLEPAAPK